MKITHVKLSSSRLVKNHGISRSFQVGEKGVTSIDLDQTTGLLVIRKGADDETPIGIPAHGCDWVEMDGSKPVAAKGGK